MATTGYLNDESITNKDIFNTGNGPFWFHDTRWWTVAHDATSNDHAIRYRDTAVSKPATPGDSVAAFVNASSPHGAAYYPNTQNGGFVQVRHNPTLDATAIFTIGRGSQTDDFHKMDYESAKPAWKIDTAFDFAGAWTTANATLFVGNDGRCYIFYISSGIKYVYSDTGQKNWSAVKTLNTTGIDLPHAFNWQDGGSAALGIVWEDASGTIRFTHRLESDGVETFATEVEIHDGTPGIRQNGLAGGGLLLGSDTTSTLWLAFANIDNDPHWMKRTAAGTWSENSFLPTGFLTHRSTYKIGVVIDVDNEEIYYYYVHELGAGADTVEYFKWGADSDPNTEDPARVIQLDDDDTPNDDMEFFRVPERVNAGDTLTVFAEHDDIEGWWNEFDVAGGAASIFLTSLVNLRSVSESALELDLELKTEANSRTLTDAGLPMDVVLQTEVGSLGLVEVVLPVDRPLIAEALSRAFIEAVLPVDRSVTAEALSRAFTEVIISADRFFSPEINTRLLSDVGLTMDLVPNAESRSFSDARTVLPVERIMLAELISQARAELSLALDLVSIAKVGTSARVDAAITTGGIILLILEAASRAGVETVVEVDRFVVSEADARSRADAVAGANRFVVSEVSGRMLADVTPGTQLVFQTEVQSRASAEATARLDLLVSALAQGRSEIQAALAVDRSIVATIKARARLDALLVGLGVSVDELLTLILRSYHPAVAKSSAHPAVESSRHSPVVITQKADS